MDFLQGLFILFFFVPLTLYQKNMNDKEIQKIIELAKRLNELRLSKEEALETFVSAGILTKKGNFRKPYAELKSIISEQA